MAFRYDQNDRCPHCGVSVQFVLADFYLGDANYGFVRHGIWFDEENSPTFWACKCPSCSKVIIEAVYEDRSWLVEPRCAIPRPIHPTVPDSIAKDFAEAQLVLPVSPTASAALARRCLQAILIANGASSNKRLVDQLGELYPTFPGYVQAHVDHIRQLGNLASHPMQDGTTGIILDVEAGEAEWLIEVLSELLDHYYTKPAEQAARASAIQTRLANKKPMSK